MTDRLVDRLPSTLTPDWVSECGEYVLFCRDCRDVLPLLPDGLVDAVVTDPPYGLGDCWRGGFNGSNGKSSVWPDNAPSWDNPELVNDAVYWCSQQKQAIIWGGHYYCLPITRCLLIWDKLQVFSSADAEVAWTNLEMPIRVFGMSRIDAHKNCAETKKSHPTEKPTRLISWCIKWTDGRVVFDPFTGSGTTGVACVKLERSFVGIELERKYFDIAVRRIQQALDDRGLFKDNPAPPMAKQLTLDDA